MRNVYRLVALFERDDCFHIQLEPFERCDPFSAVVLALAGRRARRNGRTVKLELSEDSPLARFLDKLHFREVLDLGASSGYENISSSNRILVFERSNAVADEVESTVRRIGEHLAREVSFPVERFSVTAAELADNFFMHASTDSVLVTVEGFEETDSVMLALGDTGVGMRESLWRNPEYRKELENLSDGEVVRKSLEKGVTGKLDHRGGMGLTEVREFVREVPGGQLILASDGGIFQFSSYRQKGRSPSENTYNHDYPFSGVQCAVTVYGEEVQAA